MHTPAGNVLDAHDAALVLERMNEGFYAIDRAWRLLYVNPRAEAFWGRSSASLLGRSMLELFPRFAGSPAHAAHEGAMEGGEPTRVEVVSTATGRPVELRLFPSSGGLSVYFDDLAPRRKMEQEIQTQEELLGLAELSAGIGVWVADLREGTVTARPEFFRLLGIEPVDGPVSQDLPRALRHPEDRERVTQGFRDALASGAETYETEYRIIRPNGEQRWIFGRGRVTRDEAGKPWRYAGVDLDITERKKQEEHLRIVMGELLHRTNNLLTVVQGMSRQIARGCAGIDEFVPALNSRLQGLGVSTSLLTLAEWRGVQLDDLVRAQVAPFAEMDRFEMSGPDILLTPKAAQNLGLALHELGTNAIKYGALSVPAGRIRVNWEITAAGLLHMRWKEAGGPPVVQPTRAGFGRVVTEQMIAAALDAVVDTSYDAGGIEWTLELSPTSFSLLPEEQSGAADGASLV
jgi:PAS domain S-box-containing protein